MIAIPMVPTDDEIDPIVQTCRERGLREFDVFRVVLRTLQHPSPFPTAQVAIDRDRIRDIFMAHGFKIKEGQTDIEQYVYDAADALIREVCAHRC